MEGLTGMKKYSVFPKARLGQKRCTIMNLYLWVGFGRTGFRHKHITGDVQKICPDDQ